MKQALLAAALAALSLSGHSAAAQERVTLGFARIFNNDAIGDTKDRWRTGSYSVSRFRAERWDGHLPATFGELLEVRLRAEIIAPESLTNPTPDRRYVGIIAPGIATHFDMGGFETRVGLDLVITGPQTGVGRFQRDIHKMFGFDRPTVLDSQIPDGFHPTLEAEIGRNIKVTERLTLRPFVEAQAGVESFVRVGGDVVLGDFGRGGLFARDVVTGQRALGIERDVAQGFSLTLGGDVARVFDSEYLPSGGTADLADSRSRLRAGVHWQGERAAAFYGVTWLGKEYESQPEGQVVGSLRVNLRF